MKTKDFELFVKTGVIDTIEIIIEKEKREIKVHAFSRKLVDDMNFDGCDLYIHTALNKVRKWKTIDAAYNFIIEAGWDCDVLITNKDPEITNWINNDDEWDCHP